MFPWKYFWKRFFLPECFLILPFCCCCEHTLLMPWNTPIIFVTVQHYCSSDCTNSPVFALSGWYLQQWIPLYPLWHWPLLPFATQCPTTLPSRFICQWNWGSYLQSLWCRTFLFKPIQHTCTLRSRRIQYLWTNNLHCEYTKQYWILQAVKPRQSGDHRHVI